MGKWNKRRLFMALLCLPVLSLEIQAKSNTEADNAADLVTQQNSITLSGIVTDEMGEPIPGVSVSIEGNSNGVITDIDGKYAIKISNHSGQKIKFSFIGMKTVTYTFDGSQRIYNVTMETDDVTLDDVVVIGYGSKNRKSLTSSISSVNKEQVEQLAATTTTMDNLLAGTVKGVLATATSGEPGAALKINIRGITSPYPNSSTGQPNNVPLYVIDGVPMFMDNNSLNPLINISPNDIESIDVLKDAAATAIYGSRGANGVIIVKTKDGRKGEKVSVEAGYTFSVGNPVKQYKPLNTTEFKDLQNTIYENTVRVYNASQGNLVGWNGVMTGIESLQLLANITQEYDDNFNPYLVYNGLKESAFGNANTDWADETTHHNAPTHQYNISVRGGSEKTNYAFSFNGINQQGLRINDRLERYGARMNIDSHINSYITFGTNMSYSYTKRVSGSIESDLDDGMGGSLWKVRPDIAVRNEYGTLNRIDVSSYQYGYNYTDEWGEMKNIITEANPVAQLLNRNADNTNDQFIGSAYLEVTPLKGFKLRADASFSRYGFKNAYFMPSSVFPYYDMGGGLVTTVPASLTDSEYSSTTSSINFRAEYRFNIDRHAVSFMAGYGADRTWNKGKTVIYSGFPENEDMNNIGSAGKVSGYTDSSYLSGLNSVYGRATYDYNERYLAEISMRADASSKFGPNNKWGVFPAISLGWRINNETFMQDFKQIDDLKLRLSWGKTGSTNVADFSYNQYYQSKLQYQGSPGVTLLTTLPNEDLKWEMTTEYNAGLDYSFFNNRLFGNLDFYFRKTDGALAPAPHILEGGFPTYYANIIDMSNRGVEFSIGGDIVRKKDFSWTSIFNIAANRNKIERLNGASINPNMQDAFIEGMPVGTLKGYAVEGIFQNEEEVNKANAYAQAKGKNEYQSYSTVGDYKLVDTDGNGTITTDDKIVIANPEPKCFGGWSNTLNYKSFSLSMLFQYSIGGEALYYNLMNDITPNSLGQSVLREVYQNTWTPENKNAEYAQLVAYSNNTYNSSYLDKYVFKTSYFRMKDISLSYQIPQLWLKRFGIGQASVFASMSNVFTISQWPGLDPETVGSSVTSMSTNSDPYPMSRTFSMGIKIKL